MQECAVRVHRNTKCWNADSTGDVLVVGEILVATGSAGHLVYQVAVLEAVTLLFRYTKKLQEEKFFVLVAQSKGRGSAGWIEITDCIKQEFLETQREAWMSQVFYIIMWHLLSSRPGSAAIFLIVNFFFFFFILLYPLPACLSSSLFSCPSSTTLGYWIAFKDGSPRLLIFPAPHRGQWLASSWFATFKELFRVSDRSSRKYLPSQNLFLTWS